MSGFQFPPPPPPPPKPALSFGDAQQFGQSRGSGRGRGRSRHEVRGRGGRDRVQRGPRQDKYDQQQMSLSSSSSGMAQAQYGQPDLHLVAAGLPPGSYINPAFQRSMQSHSTNTYDTQANTATTQHHAPPSEFVSPLRSSELPQRTSVGHKRKLEALRGAPREKKPKPPTAPAVPVFGATTPRGKPATTQAAPPLLPRPSFNALGLNPQSDQPQDLSGSESDGHDDDIDEESMLAALGSSLTFEHNGTVLSLKSAADLAAWRHERLKNYPTKARQAAKMKERRELGQERLRLLTEASDALNALKSTKTWRQGNDAANVQRSAARSVTTDRHPFDRATYSPPPSGTTAGQSQEHHGGALVTQDARSGTKSGVSELEGSNTHTDIDRHNTDKYQYSIFTKEICTLEEAEGGLRVDESDKSSINSSSSSNTSSEIVSDGESDDDDPPEETSSKAPIGTISTPCRFFIASGFCREGDSCRFKHDLPKGGRQQLATTAQQQRRDAPKIEPRSDRKSIHDRLLEQQQQKEEELALQVIKHLGRIGLFNKN